MWDHSCQWSHWWFADSEEDIVMKLASKLFHEDISFLRVLRPRYHSSHTLFGYFKPGLPCKVCISEDACASFHLNFRWKTVFFLFLSVSCAKGGKFPSHSCNSWMSHRKSTLIGAKPQNIFLFCSVRGFIMEKDGFLVFEALLKGYCNHGYRWNWRVAFFLLQISSSLM